MTICICELDGCNNFFTKKNTQKRFCCRQHKEKNRKSRYRKNINRPKRVGSEWIQINVINNPDSYYNCHIKPYEGIHSRSKRATRSLQKYCRRLCKRISYRLKAKYSHLEFDIDADYIADMWTGKCCLTGMDIHLYNDKMEPNTATLDRIDNNKGYVKGNVRWVAWIYNKWKSNMSDEEMISYAKRLVYTTTD